MNVVLFLALLLVCCGYSAAYGGAPERIAAAIIAAAVAATVVIGSIQFVTFQSAEIGIIVIDAVMAVALMGLALRANRYWPMAMTACVGVGLLGHTAVWAAPSIVPQVYAVFHAFSGYPALLILAAGTYRHRRRLIHNGIDRPWSFAQG
ncbi:hypothetical protein OKW76_13030 [Sphingomonas sp. S1-29]|uniref:hypothetical protein n=1 Tax=Sphingomonas sp. S1-29 TaxID=2991074 RepID=UPI00223F745B|nr:hypothetical protein [Sphingomonas sp. S1-29]UZK68940.1 hypothetical protein OKW76_13030 [Sphingomonas sp. S1-29]